MKEIKEYRDKFIAHTDLKNTMNVPHMDIPCRMVTFLYTELKTCSSDSSIFVGLPATIPEYYVHCYKESLNVFNLNHALKNDLGQAARPSAS
jgi:hypothetical protein